MGALIFFLAGTIVFSVSGIVILLNRVKRQEEKLDEYEQRLWLLELSAKGSASPHPAPKPVQTFSPPEAPAVPPALDDLPSSEQAEPTRPLFPALSSFVRKGNLWAAGGVCLLIAAFAMLISYLARHGFFTVEMGIAGAVLSGLVMVGLGWGLRKKRPTYFLILQGGGIGILYLSIFAAYKLTIVLSAPAAITLMTILIPPAIVLALFQSSQPLALFGFLGGYAAPILLAGGLGNHVFLFAYYTALCLGVLGTGIFRRGIFARSHSPGNGFRPWKGLNLLAFVCTFAVSLFWVMNTYTENLFASTEPFIIGFILIFTALSIISIQKQQPARQGAVVDAVLIPGTPFAGALLEWKLFSFFEHGYALVCITLSVFYLLLALFIYKKFRQAQGAALRAAAEAYLTLGVLLANLAIPLELAPRITAAIWAAEGVAVFLFGLWRNDVRVRIGGLILHTAAAIAFGVEWGNYFYRGNYDVPAYRSLFFAGSLVIGVSALVMAIFAKTVSRTKETETARRFGPFFPLHEIVFCLWGFFWWYAGWLFEFNRLYAGTSSGIQPWEAFFILTSFTSLAAFALARRFRIPLFMMSGIPVLITAFFTVFGTFTNRLAVYFSEPEQIFTYNFFHSFRLWGWLAFIVVQPVLIFLFWKQLMETSSAGPVNSGEKKAWCYGSWVFADVLILVGVFSASMRYGIQSINLSESWRSLAGLVPVFAVLILITFKFPFVKKIPAPGPAGKLLFFALPMILAFFLGLWFIFSLFHPGNPDPLPFYLPLVNPLDILGGFCIAAITLWLLKQENNRRLPVIIGDPMLFLWIIAIVSRCFHFYGNIPWGGVWQQGSFHLALFIFLAVYGITHIILGNRLSLRSLWIAGAVIIVTDVAKLLLFDMAEAGTVPRIVSFFIAGLVLLFIGWAAPLPPKEN